MGSAAIRKRVMMMPEELKTNVVILSVAGFNQVIADNYRLNMMLDALFNEAMISKDHEHIVFDTRKVEAALKFCFPERLKKKLYTLKTQHTRYGVAGAPDETEPDEGEKENV